ncbi:hypothetical protein F7725_024738 [Dissostichus mawsoni]|uniref:Uncharacterized protein n=1 Tax=Dissostichus mawsoni TaxID=36200 RepID=A0A7J5X952_DISMA|nr:hypothetical protein F7725_024738 [Dissostichus mawsoni]
MDLWQTRYSPHVKTLHTKLLQLFVGTQGLQVCVADEGSAEPGMKPMVSDSFPLESFRLLLLDSWYYTPGTRLLVLHSWY